MEKKSIKIGEKLISEKSPCFIIAEAGVNHNGSLELAKKLVEAAKEAGVDAVKFQTFKSENLVTKSGKMAEYQKKNTGKEESQLEMLKKLELSYQEFKKLKKYCDKKGIIFLSTPHTEDAVDFLNPLVPAFKVGSGDLTNLPVLEKIAKKRKPIIIGTGMATLKEVKEAVESILPTNKKLILLHCTTNYPTSLDEVNLKAMLTLKKEFKLITGYSDHTEGINISLAAVSLGACVIEKHFTLDKNLPGPDHKASLEPKELKKLVEGIRNIEESLGNGIKKPKPSEIEIAKIARKSLVAARDIMAGKKIEEGMLAIKRPGTGILPKYLNKVVGRTAKRNIKKDNLIKFKDLQ